MGTNGYSDVEKAQLFPNSTSGVVNSLLVFFGSIEIVGSADNTEAYIYSGTQSGGPSNLEGTSDQISVSAIDTSGMLTQFNFSTPVPFSGDFFGSILVDTGNDTIGIVHTGAGCLSNAWEKWDDNSWNNVDTAWGGFDVSMIVFAVIDDAPVGQNEHLLSGRGLELFPNPAEASLTLSLEEQLHGDAVVQIRSIDGKSAAKLQMEITAGQDEYHLNVETLPRGTYVLEVREEQRTMRQIFVKK